MQLDALLAALRQSAAIDHKQDIQAIADIFHPPGRTGACGDAPASDYPNGDDAAVLRSSDGYDLLAAEGFLPEFVQQDPWFAGWCGLMVNISDIAAMGGRPVAVTNTLWGGRDEVTRKVLLGLSHAAQVFQVPVVGGHTNLHSPQLHLSVAIMGRARSLLSSFAAVPGQVLVAAIDLRGSYRPPFRNWNAATTAPPQRLRGDLELLPQIAEQGLACAAKDISQAGLLGTATMLLESSQVGAQIELEKIPKPAQVDWFDWLQTFPSFGYLLTTSTEQLPALLARFAQRDIHAAAIGEITDDKILRVHYRAASGEFWNLNKQAFTGFGPEAQSVQPLAVAGQQPVNPTIQQATLGDAPCA